MTGDKAAVTVTYSGSVTEILTGAQHSATGTASDLVERVPLGGRVGVLKPGRLKSATPRLHI